MNAGRPVASEANRGAGWYAVDAFPDGLVRLTEPAVHPLIRCNIWYIHGRDSDLVVDTGLGLAPLRKDLPQASSKPLLAVATHAHFDHIGAMHEFDERAAHAAEAPLLEQPDGPPALDWNAFPPEIVEGIGAAGYDTTAPLVAGTPPSSATEFSIVPAPPTRLLAEGDVLHTGDRSFEVIELPGHTPGSIGLWERSTGILFAGDAVYDGPLLDELPESDISSYCETMHRLMQLPVTVVHAGHEPSFGPARLREIARGYLDRRSPA